MDEFAVLKVEVTKKKKNETLSLSEVLVVDFWPNVVSTRTIVGLLRGADLSFRACGEWRDLLHMKLFFHLQRKKVSHRVITHMFFFSNSDNTTKTKVKKPKTRITLFKSND